LNAANFSFILNETLGTQSMKMSWPVIIGIAVCAVIGYVGSRVLGYGDPALFGGVGAAVGVVIGLIVAKSRPSTI
jgi:hypothetical protein